MGLDDHGFGGVGVFGEESVGGEFFGDLVGDVEGGRRLIIGEALGEALGDPDGHGGRVREVQRKLKESGHLGLSYVVWWSKGADKSVVSLEG